MGRLVRNTVILGKIETTPYVDAVPTGAANAIFFGDAKITPIDGVYVARKVQAPYFGAAQKVLVGGSTKLEFVIEAAGGGTAGTAPPMDVVLQIAGLAGATAATPARYEYNGVSTGFKTATFYYYDDGVMHILLGCIADLEFSFNVAGMAEIKVSIIGRNGGFSATTNAIPTLTAWKFGTAVTDANTADVTFGGTYAAGVVTGGTAYPGLGIDTLKLGNKTVYNPMLGGDSIDLTERNVTASITLDLTAAQEVTLANTVQANSMQSLSLLHGTAAGYKILIFLTTVALTNWSKENKDGKRLIKFDVTSIPSTGNDDFRLILL